MCTRRTRIRLLAAHFVEPIHGEKRLVAMKNYVHRVMKSPVGKLTLVASDRGLAAILWENDNPRRVKLGKTNENNTHPLLLETERQLKEYFQGSRRSFSLELDLVGTTFQKKVWKALLGIPFGETRRYGELAKQLGNPRATRAVGAANGRNPISIIVPCHRVIGSDGKLTGFAGGLGTKRQLLGLESSNGLDEVERRPCLSDG